MILPDYAPRLGEALEVKRARLLYQSRYNSVGGVANVNPVCGRSDTQLSLPPLCNGKG